MRNLKIILDYLEVRLMDKKKCRMQTMDEFLSNTQPWEIEDTIFIKIKNAYSNCLNLLWIEEKLNIVNGNFYEWEQEIKDSYDFLIKTQSDKPDCNNIMNEHGTKEIIVLNRRLFNVLNSIRMYRDQILHDLSNFGDEFKKKFKKETNQQYDKTFSYQLMELLRNYMQHQGLVIERITAIIPYNRKIEEELWYFAEANYKNIESIDNFKQKIKLQPQSTEKIEWINLIGLLREYYIQILELHKFFRVITEEIYCKEITYIEDTVKKVYKNLPIKVIAFYEKENSEETQDFLLHMDYLNKLKLYRRKDVILVKTQYYIAKKYFLESDKIKVSNSVECRFRYNKS